MVEKERPLVNLDRGRVERIIPMARSKRNAQGDEVHKPNPTGKWGILFLDIQLSEEDKGVLRQAKFEPEMLYPFMERLCSDGYKCSSSFDSNNRCWLFSITAGKDCVHTENRGYCLVSRGSTYERAILSAMFKIEHYCPAGIFPLNPQSRDLDFG
jgi:hypothetical protein